MEKQPFHISATKQGATALIRITGEIGWDTDAELFRAQVDEIISQGAEDVHIYINSPGGSCFDAAEIVNILSRFNGKVTGEGGALVASAGTFIAEHCESFIMPENGMFMIHKPAGYTGGTASKIEGYLKLLKNIESQYFDIYKAKATNADELQKQWQAGDWWMTAGEAKENGFITGVKEKVKVDKETTALITACGCPATKIPSTNFEKNESEMDLKATAKSLGLSENATEEEVNAKIEAGRKAEADLEAMKVENARKEKEAKEKMVKAEVQKAIEEKRITADIAPTWTLALTNDYDTNIKLLNALSPVTKIPISQGKQGSPTGGGKVTYQGKTFEELQDEDPDALGALQNDDPSAYDELFNDYLKRNKLK